MWEIRVVVDIHPITKRSVQRSWTVRGDETTATATQADLVSQFGLRRVPRSTDGARLTVSELIERFLAAPRVWSPATYRSYSSPARFLARDPFGEVRLGRLTPAQVDAAIARWVRVGAGPAVVLGRYRLLHSSITWGLHEQYLRGDPLAGHRAPKAPLPRKHLPPKLGRRLLEVADALAEKASAAFDEQPDSRRRLLAAFRGDLMALLVRLAADTGARLGELTALQLADLDAGRLTIERAAKGRGVIGPTRRIGGGRSPSGRSSRNAGRVTSRPGSPTPSSGARRGCSPQCPRVSKPSACPARPCVFRRARAAVGVPEATLHRLRHTVGTHLVRRGDLLGAKPRLGHDNLSTTLRNYVDDDGVDNRGTAMSLDELYNNEAASPAEYREP